MSGVHALGRLNRKPRRIPWLARCIARVASKTMSGSLGQSAPPAPAPSPMGASAPPGMGAGATTGQPPFGSSPVSQPTPNRGMEAAGLARLSVVVRLLEEVVPLLGVSTPPGKDVIKALNTLAKHIPAGSVPPGVQQSTLQALMQKNQQMSPQIAAVRAMQPPIGEAAPPPAGGAMPPSAQ